MQLVGDIAPKCLLKWTANGNLMVRFGFSKIKGSAVYLLCIWIKPDNKELMTQNPGLLQCPALVIALCNFPVVFNLFLDTDTSSKPARLNRVCVVVLPGAARTAGAASGSCPQRGLQNRTLHNCSDMPEWGSCSLASSQLVTFSWKSFVLCVTMYFVSNSRFFFKWQSKDVS